MPAPSSTAWAAASSSAMNATTPLLPCVVAHSSRFTPLLAIASHSRASSPGWLSSSMVKALTCCPPSPRHGPAPLTLNLPAGGPADAPRRAWPAFPGPADIHNGCPATPKAAPGVVPRSCRFPAPRAGGTVLLDRPGQFRAALVLAATRHVIRACRQAATPRATGLEAANGGGPWRGPLPQRRGACVQDGPHQFLQGADEVLLAHHNGAVTGVDDIDRAAWRRPVRRGTARTCSIRFSQRPAAVRPVVSTPGGGCSPSQPISVTTTLTGPVWPRSAPPRWAGGNGDGNLQPEPGARSAAHPAPGHS